MAPPAVIHCNAQLHIPHQILPRVTLYPRFGANFFNLNHLNTTPKLTLQRPKSVVSNRAPGPGFHLTGSNSFVRTNPRSDLFQVNRFHHVEFWGTDATNAAHRFSWGLGMPIVGKSDLFTGNRIHASYLLRSGDLSFLFSAPYSPKISAGVEATAVLPSFSTSACLSFSAKHGLAVRAIAVEVDDASAAFAVSVTQGAKPASPPVLLENRVGFAEVYLSDDVVLRFISYTNSNLLDPDLDPGFWFLPGFKPCEAPSSSLSEMDYGIRRLDHAAVNFPDLAAAANYLKSFTGFHEFSEFTAEEVGTSQSGLNSVVMANNDETVLLTVVEPAYGTNRKSQIETYLDHNDGAGVQHMALESGDIFRTLREMKKRSAIGGFEFMPSPQPAYYRDLKKRVGDVLTDEQIRDCKELGILVDRDDEGTLLQIFTKPIGDRPTVFIEIIQRIGCMHKDEKGKVYQKSGCGGFGKGNVSELYKCLEEYDKSLESRRIA